MNIKFRNIKIFVLGFLLSFSAITGLWGQTSKRELYNSPEKTGGVYYAYPYDKIIPESTLPQGYEPFYISHFGRHGSRFLISDNEYRKCLIIFQKADSCNALTSLGKDVLLRLQKIMEEAEGKGGKLTPLGEQQLKDIGARMYFKYSAIFNDSARVTAVSTTVDRCILSMNMLSGKLMELNPHLSIDMDADLRHMSYLNFHTPEAVSFRSSPTRWKVAYKKFEKGHVHPQRFFKSLFTSDCFLSSDADPASVMWDVFNIAGILQNMETKLSLYDLFNKKELFDLWQCGNYELYVKYANAAENKEVMMSNAVPLLKNIILSADDYINSNLTGASLRFGHDGNIIPLAMLLHLEGCYNKSAKPSDFYKVWSNFKVAPMAGNIQLVFFRNICSGDVLVKFLLNENEILVSPVHSNILPFYHWNDVKKYYSELINRYDRSLSSDSAVSPGATVHSK